MDQKIRKQNKKELAISLETVTKGFLKGIGWLLGFVANLEKEGKDEYAEQGEITGKTKSGKEYRGVYGFRMKTGLNRESLRIIKKLPGESTENKP